MGTNTDFTGAIRITPCVEEPLATRLKQFMDIRHMKRNVKTLHTLFPDLEDRKPMSLFGDGDFGEEGAFFIPVETPDLNRRLHEAGPYPEGLDNKFSMNKPPNPCPSLYCDLVLLNDPNNGRSYLGWNEAEKSYYITDWCQRQSEIVRKRRRNFVVFRRGGGNKNQVLPCSKRVFTICCFWRINSLRSFRR